MNPATPPLVSILLCLYNGEQYLDETIESALAQSFRDFELIIIDDGSTDGSAAIAARYLDHPAVRLVRQENRGQAGAVDTGLAQARGRYIAILDQDDLWDAANLEEHVRMLEHDSTLAATFSWFRVIDAAGYDTGLHSSRYRGAIDFAGLLTDFVIGASSNTVMRRSAIDMAGGVDLGLPLVFDVDLCLRLALLGSHNIAAIPRELMLYRRHPGQSSRDPHRMMTDWSRMVEQMQRRAPAEVARVLPQARSNQYRYLARLCYEEERYAPALTYLGLGCGASPGAFIGDFRNFLTLAAAFSGVLLPRGIHQRLERLAGFTRACDSARSGRPVSQRARAEHSNT